MQFIKRILQRNPSAQPETIEATAQHPNFWMY